VNAVSVHSKEGAERFLGQLEKDGWNAYIEEATKGDRVWYLVRVGSFPNRDEAHRAGQEISDWYNLGGYMILRKSTE
jgi:cell division protein FtsN